MISHALTIIINELKKHFDDIYGVNAQGNTIGLRNIAVDFSASVHNSGVNSSAADAINFTLVNIKEDKSLKNSPFVSVNKTPADNPALWTAEYANPSVFLNFNVLITATHANYADALVMLSRVIRFFQYKNVFTQDDVTPSSIVTNAPTNTLDRLSEFKLIFDLYSPSMEESNHMWGTLGGKQYPFVMYYLRMLDLRFKTLPRTEPVIQEVVQDVKHK